MKYKTAIEARLHTDRFRIGFEWWLPLDKVYGGFFVFDLFIWTIGLHWDPVE